jgi:hypothetical protein
MQIIIQVISSNITTNVLLLIGLLIINNLDQQLALLNKTSRKAVYNQDF